MTPERIKLFLRCFYERYTEASYQGYELLPEQAELTDELGKYDVNGYFLKHLDIYIQNCDFRKEYGILYNPSLFESSKEAQAEAFNELELFLIENIQLFLHTILEAAIHSGITGVKVASQGLKIYMRPVDNKSLRLIDLIDAAEQRMKELKVLPPAMG